MLGLLSVATASRLQARSIPSFRLRPKTAHDPIA